MFYISMHFLFASMVTCFCVSSASDIVLNPDKPSRSHLTKIIQNDDTTQRASPLLFYNEHKTTTRSRRGIVLIDEDFDKLPDINVRQSWSDGKPETEDLNLAKETEKDWLTEEGSGSSFTNQATTVKLVVTPDELQMTPEENISTIITNDDTMEGSGDDTTQFFTKIPEKEVTVPEASFTGSCLNFTCDEKDLIILPGFAETITEETTLTLLCSIANYSSGDTLHWYKTNNSNNILLETSSLNKLPFTLPKTKTQDSGKYACVKLSEKSCCHRLLDVTIYKKPNYKYHLLIVGLVAAVSLFTCLLLGIHRRYKIKQCKKELKNQIPMNDFLL